MARPPAGQPDTPPALPPQGLLRSTQVIYLVLIIATLLLSGFASYWSLRGSSANPVSAPIHGQALMSMLPIVGFSSVLVALVMPVMMRRAARQRWLARADDDLAIAQAVQGYQAAAILRAALLEGVGIMGAITVYLTANLWALLAPAVILILLLAVFPKTSDMQSWLDFVTGSED